MWVSSSASTTGALGQRGDRLPQGGENLVAVGSPLATSRGRRQQATSRTRRCRVRSDTAGRPSRCQSRGTVHAPDWPSSPRIRSPSRGLPRHQAGPEAVGPCSRQATPQGQPAGQDGLAYTLQGRILAAASWVVWCVEAPTAHEARSSSATRSTGWSKPTTTTPSPETRCGDPVLPVRCRPWNDSPTRSSNTTTTRSTRPSLSASGEAATW
jgi:hypothetical protein